MSCPHCWLDEPVQFDPPPAPPQPGYVYRCSRCGECYACGHVRTADGQAWRCADGAVRMGVDLGVRVSAPFSKR